MTAFFISAGIMANDMYNVAKEDRIGCLTCSRFSGQASNTQMIIAPAIDASMGVEIKVSQNTGFYFDLGLLYAQAKCRYHFEDVFIDENASYDSISSENKLTFNDFYLYSTVALHFYLFRHQKFYIYAGVRPELVIHDFSHESGTGTEAIAKIINGVIQSPVVSEYSFDESAYIDHNGNFDVVGGLGMRIGKPNSGRMSLELGGFNGFIRYREYDEPSTKRAGLELKLIYAFKNSPPSKLH